MHEEVRIHKILLGKCQAELPEFLHRNMVLEIGLWEKPTIFIARVASRPIVRTEYDVIFYETNES